MAGTRNSCTAMSKDFNFAYVHGGGNSSRIIKYNLSTEANQFSTTHGDGHKTTLHLVKVLQLDI